MEQFMKALEKIKESKDKKSKEVKLSMYRWFEASVKKIKTEKLNVSINSKDVVFNAS
jgi:hypothetical protein